MFLKELWHFNKTGALLFLLVISFWIFLNIKQGAVATPLLQYGMYSSAYRFADTQHVLQLYINKSRVDYTKYSTAERDHLQTYIEDYLVEKKNNEMIFNTMHRLLKKVGIGQWMKKENYTNAINDTCFTAWYKRLAEKITGKKINLLEAFHQDYTWQNNRLTEISAPVKVTLIVAY